MVVKTRSGRKATNIAVSPAKSTRSMQAKDNNETKESTSTSKRKTPATAALHKKNQNADVGNKAGTSRKDNGKKTQEITSNGKAEKKETRRATRSNQSSLNFEGNTSTLRSGRVYSKPNFEAKNNSKISEDHGNISVRKASIRAETSTLSNSVRKSSRIARKHLQINSSLRTNSNFNQSIAPIKNHAQETNISSHKLKVALEKVDLPPEVRIDTNQSGKRQVNEKNKSFKAKAKRKKSPTKRAELEIVNKCLRPRRKSQKYNDYETKFSTDDDLEENGSNGVVGESQKRVPIYKQPLKTSGKAKRLQRADVYAFDAIDSKSNSDSDNDYDVDMLDELKRIRGMEKRAKLLRLRRKKGLPPTQQRQKIVKVPVDLRTLPRQEIVPKNIKIISNIKIIAKDKSPLTKCSIMQNFDDNESICAYNHDSDNESIVSNQIDSMKTAMSRLVNSNASNMSYQQFQLPVANSTMMMVTSSPWRPLLRYKNGPHVLHTKRDSSLPAFNQEMVLNSTIVDLHEASRINASMRVAADQTDGDKAIMPRRSPRKKQMSILTFISGAQLPSDDSKQMTTLFDENLLLSPVKQPDNSENKSSGIGKVVHFACQLSEKTVLRDRSNILQVSTVANTPERDSSDVEFFKTSPRDVPTGKPTRFNLRRSPKPAKRMDESIDKERVVEDDGLVDASVFESPTSQSATHDATKLVGIFDDFEPLEIPRPTPNFTYMPRRRRRLRNPDQEAKSSDNEYSPTKESRTRSKRAKQKKDGMTKKEKYEFDKWVDSFNDMCDNVDKYELCVE